MDTQGKMFHGRDGPIYRCATCLSSAVTTQAEAEHLYHDTCALLRRELTLEIAILPKLHLTERATLAALHQLSTLPASSDASPGPEQQHLLGFFQRINDDWDIYIEHLLPRTLFQAVAAHELAHAWQATHAPQTQVLKIVEGFAEWVAYQVLLALGQQREAARLTRRSDLYGDGLQYFIKLEREDGRKGVLQRASKV